MFRFRALAALGILLGLSGCLGPGHYVATRPYRPPGERFGTDPGLGQPAALTNRPPERAARFFPLLARRSAAEATPAASGAVPPSGPPMSARTARSSAPRAARTADDSARTAGVSEPSPPVSEPSPPVSAEESEPSTLPVSLRIEIQDDEPEQTPKPPGALALATPDVSRDDATRLAQAEGENDSEPSPPVASPEESSDDASGSEPAPPRELPGSIAESRPTRPGPTNPDAVPSLAGRPRLPLVRPTNLPPDLPPATFPKSYYDPAPPRVAQAPPPPPSGRPWRIRLFDRWRQPAETSERESGSRMPVSSVPGGAGGSPTSARGQGSRRWWQTTSATRDTQARTALSRGEEGDVAQGR